MEPVTTIATVAALQKGVEKAVSALCTSNSSSIARKLKSWKTRRAMLAASTKLDQVRMVKTIWQIDRAVDLTDFYYPSKLIVDDERVTVSRLEDVPTNGNIVVRGTVGQGKSIFLRHFTIIAALDGARLPLFIELRRLQPSESLEDHILSELKVLGFGADSEVLDYLAGSGQFLLLLDAFDEVREERRERLLRELDQLSRQYPELRVVVTTRPGTGIDQLPSWTVYELAPLLNREYENVIARLCHKDNTAKSIIDGLNAAPDSIRALLTTPLMVAMLVLRHRADQSIPENQVAFFSDLFSLLLLRHDKTKAGYVRERRSGVGDKALERAFISFCYLSRKQGASAFSGQLAYDFIKEALRVSDIPASADNVLCDICSITCLLLEEGGEYRFIHKIVQEYHAACFIALQPDSSAQTFYQAMTSKWSAWKQELEFLAAIDKYRCFRFYVLPAYAATVGQGTLDEVRAKVPAHFRIGWIRETNKRAESTGKLTMQSFGASQKSAYPSWIFERYIHLEPSLRAFRLLPLDGIADDCIARLGPELPSGQYWALDADELIDRTIAVEQVQAFASSVAEILQADINRVRHDIEVTERQKVLMDV